jgi:PAS domain S-box-containing protein
MPIILFGIVGFSFHPAKARAESTPMKTPLILKDAKLSEEVPLDIEVAARVDEQLKRCLDHAAEGLHWVGPDGTILWANQTELALLGYTADEYIGRHISDFHVDAPVIEDILERLTRGETLLHYEARLLHKDGSIKYVQINSKVLWQGDTFLRTQCFTRDVTDRRAVDELVRRLAEIVANSDDAIISQDLQGVIMSWNTAAERLYGYTAAEAIGQSINIIIPAERRQEEEEVVRRVRNGERVASFDTVRRHKNGSLVDVALTVSPIRDHEGTIVGASKMARDISRRKRLEARDRFLVELDDALRPLTVAEDITYTAAKALGQHLAVNRCAYATVEDDEDSMIVTGNFNNGVESIVGRYTFRQFGAECLRLMRAGEPYVVTDSATDPRIDQTDRASYSLTAIRAVICVPILKQGRFVAAMAVHMANPRMWETEEIELVQRVAGRCWESIERAKVTQSLKENERQFRAMANSIPNLAWMARPDGWIYWYNDQWYEYTGTTPEQMEGWGWERVHDPAILPEVKEQWKRSIASGMPFEKVFPLRGADGQFRRFLTRVNPVLSADGEVIQWFGTNTDVEAERRAAEANAELRKREHAARQEAELQKRLLHSLFMQAPTLIAVLRGPEHVIELANPPVCQVWKHSHEELINRSLFDVMPELRDQVFQSLLDEVYRTGVPYEGKETPAKLIRRDGTTETVYFNFLYSPFRNIEGDVEGIFVVASDVTDQVLARNEVDRLRQGAEAANRAKDEFLAMLGHELRNPLSPILTALQLMKLRGDDDMERERTIIERQVNHLTRLVDDLLDVSRIARGRVDLKKEVIEMAEVVASAIEMTSPLLEQRMHSICVKLPREGLAVEGDPTRLSQVVSNLISNAAKYTPPGGNITISGETTLEEVILRVCDTGVGIAPDVLPRIFDLFVQEKQAIDRSQGGLGLGLTIVRSLVERHGGTVSVHSEGPGLGAEFIIRLPKTNSGSSVLQRLLPLPTMQPEICVADAGLRVLMVDDNEDSALMLSEALKTMGYQTRIAHDAPAALLAAADFQPELALLDIGLPVMDGYELAARLRELPGLKGIRLIALTGYGQESDRQKTSAAGFEHHLVKPVNLSVLESIIAQGTV